jgi:cytochrome c2
MKRCALILLVSALGLSALGCSKLSAGMASERSGSERSAPELMTQYGCPACHVIPHVPGAVGKVGPSLYDLDHRSYLVGKLPNTPENLRQWITHPQHFQPGTAMPEMGVTEPDAERIAQFLEAHQ